MIGARRSMLWIVTSRIIAIAVVVVLLQLAQVANDYYFDEAELAKNFIEREAATLAKGVHTHAGELQFALPEAAARYGRGERSAYAFRVLDSKGNTIGAGQASMVEQVSPWVPGAPNWPDKWLRRLDERWLHVSGGQRMRVGGHDVRIEIATLGDPDAAYWGVLVHELTEHVTLPMGPLLLTILFVTMFTVRRTLLPLASAAEQADAIDPRNPNAVLTPANMTAEIASFVAAVNRALERVRQIVQSQKMFLANVAHELRTPLSIMLLELHKIDDPRALRLQGDVRAMSRLVDQLLVLERLELVAGQDASAVDLEEVARATLARLAPWIADQGDNVEFEVDRPGAFNGDGRRSRMPCATWSRTRSSIRRPGPRCASAWAPARGCAWRTADPGWRPATWGRSCNRFRRATRRRTASAWASPSCKRSPICIVVNSPPADPYSAAPGSRSALKALPANSPCADRRLTD